MGAFDSNFYKKMLNSKEIGNYSDKPLFNDKEGLQEDSVKEEEETIVCQEYETYDLKPDNPFEAFTYMFKVPRIEWKAAVVIIAIFVSTGCERLPETVMEAMGLPLIILMLLLLIVLYPWIYGWVLNSMGSLALQKNAFEFPKFNFKNDWITFLKFNVAILLFVLVLVVCAVPMVLIAVVPFLGVIVILMLSLYVMYLVMAAMAVFVHTKQLTVFLQFKKLNRIIKRSNGRYMSYFWTMVLASLTISAITLPIMFPFVNLETREFTNMIPLFITSITGGYMTFVSIYLVAKCLNIRDIESEFVC